MQSGPGCNCHCFRWCPAYEDPKKVKDRVKTSVIPKVVKKLNYMEVYNHAKKDPNHFCDILSKLILRLHISLALGHEPPHRSLWGHQTWSCVTHSIDLSSSRTQYSCNCQATSGQELPLSNRSGMIWIARIESNQYWQDGNPISNKPFQHAGIIATLCSAFGKPVTLHHWGQHFSSSLPDDPEWSNEREIPALMLALVAAAVSLLI